MAATAAAAREPARVPEIDMAFDCDVYEPAEDTFLFLDALQDELPQLQALAPAICVEIGCASLVSFHRPPVNMPTALTLLLYPCRCGSGAVSTYLATELRRLGHRALFLASDVNPLAAEVAANTARINGVQTFDVVRTDLLQTFEPRIRVRFRCCWCPSIGLVSADGGSL